MAITTHLARSLPPPGEALWTIDREGTLAAYDGTASEAAVRIPLGLPALPVAPELLPGGGLLWVYTIAGQLVIVDPAAARVVARLTVPPATPPGLGAAYHAHGALWLARAERLYRVTGTGKVTHAELPDGFGAGQGLPPAVAATRRWLWLGSGDRWPDRGNALLQVDPATGAVTLTARLPGFHIDSLEAGPPGLVATGVNQPDVIVLDPDTGDPRWATEVPDGSYIVTLHRAGDHLWAAGANGTAIRLGDQGTPITARIVLGDQGEPCVPSAGAGSLWITEPTQSQVVRLDAATGRVQARIPVTPAEPDDPDFVLLAGESAVWVLDNTWTGGYSRIDPASNQAVRVRESADAHTYSAALAPPPAAAPAAAGG
jgi:outer membrane protein assembly factor BamB